MIDEQKINEMWVITRIERNRYGRLVQYPVPVDIRELDSKLRDKLLEIHGRAWNENGKTTPKEGLSNEESDL